MPDNVQSHEPPRQLTRLEQELNGLAKFRFTDLFTRTPPEGSCTVCGRKHFNWGPDCDSCRGVA